MIALRTLGIDVLPILAEALDDNTPTNTVVAIDFRRLPSGVPHRYRVWKVSELAARLVPQIANREFVLGEWGQGVPLDQIGSQPERIPEFRKQILEWYKENKDRTPEERRIADLQSNLRNRLDATEWLGQRGCTKAIPPLIERIETILGDGEDSSSTRLELAACSLALGRIGDAKALPAVRNACKHLSYRLPDSGKLHDLFAAYRGLAMLGQKKEALAELNRIYKEFGPKMEAYTKRDYEAELSNAAGW